MKPIDTSVFVGKFVEEARDRIKALGAALLRLEQTPGDVGAIAEALREAHSIKGSALMLGLTDISQISHELEELFVAAKTNPSLLDGDAFDVIFSGVDRMTTRVEALARGEMDAVEVADICAQLGGLLETSGSDPGTETHQERRPDLSRGVCPRTVTGSDPDVPQVRKAPELRQSLRVPIEKLDRLAHLAPEMVVQSLKAFERHTELRRLERMLSRLRDRVREARLTPDTDRCRSRRAARRLRRRARRGDAPHARVPRELQRRPRAPQPHHRRAAPERHRAHDAAGRVGVRRVSRARCATSPARSARTSRSRFAAARPSSTRKSSSRFQSR